MPCVCEIQEHINKHKKRVVGVSSIHLRWFCQDYCCLYPLLFVNFKVHVLF